MSSTAQELLVIAKLKNELSRPLGQIRGDMAKVRGEIDATGKATKAQSAELRRLQREYDSTSKGLGNLGQKLSDVGGRMTRSFTLPIVAGLGLAAKAAVDDEKSQAVLANTMRRTEHATTGQVKATEAWIRKTQFATGISDNDLRPALGKLLLAHRSTTQSQHDLNVAMDVATARGMSLTTVVQAFAKAANGQTQGLRRLGIQTTDAAGRALTYDQILQKLAQTTGGSMATAANTAEGRMKRLRERTREFAEDIGARMLPIIDKGVRALSGMFDFLGRLGPAGQNFVIVGGLALAAVGPMLKLAGTVLQLAKAWRDYAAARAAGTATGLLADAGGITGAIGVGGPAIAAAAVATAAFAYQYNQGQKTGQRAKNYAIKTLGPAAVPGASPSPKDRLASIQAGQAELRKLHSWNNGGNVELPGIKSANEAYAIKDELQKRVKEQQALYRATEGNVAHLTETMHMSRAEVERLAAAHGVDLSGSLRSVASDMRQAAAAAKQNSEAITDQAAGYAQLKKNVDGLHDAKERLLDRFVNYQSAGYALQDSIDAVRKSKTSRERSQNELSALGSAASYLDAAQVAGKYGPKGLSQVGYASAFNQLVGQITKYGDPADARTLAQQYLASAAAEDPKGAAAIGDQNSFQISQVFYGYDPTKVAAAAKTGAKSGFDQAAHDAAHRKKKERQH